MTAQDLLEIQRYLRQTRPGLRAGSHDWWDAMRAEIDRRSGYGN